MVETKLLIDRDSFKPHNCGGVEGVFTVEGTQFHCCIRTKDADVERAWANAEQLVRLVLDRFTTIERRVRSDLAPELDHWTSEKISLAGLTRRTTAAMRASETVILNVTDTESEAIFDGPDIALGHAVCVVVDKAERVVSVDLA
jgi:hypothetical protein